MAKVKQIVRNQEVQDIEPVEILDENPSIPEDSNNNVSDVIDEIENHAEETKEIKEENFDFTESEDVNEQQPENKGSSLNGDFLITIIDRTIPLGLKYGTEYFNKNVRVNINKLRLDYEEKELLKPAADSVASRIFNNLTDVQQLLLGLSVIYANKMDEAISKKENE